MKGTVGIYLAAGESSRFKKNKLLAPVGKYSLGSIALLAALQSQIEKVIVVVKEADRLCWIDNSVKQDFKSKFQKVVCNISMKGQSYSLKCGLHAAENIGAEAVIMILADQPNVSKDVFNKIIRRYNKNKLVSFVGATYREIISPPVLFPSHMFSALHEIQGDKGARNLIRNHITSGILLEVNDSDVLFDVDTEADYIKLLWKMKGN